MQSCKKPRASMLWITGLALLLPGIAAAYVGPGAGITMLGALWGLIVGVVMAVGVILFWPIRMMLRKAKAKKAGAEAPAESATDSAQKSESDDLQADDRTAS